MKTIAKAAALRPGVSRRLWRLIIICIAGCAGTLAVATSSAQSDRESIRVTLEHMNIFLKGALDRVEKSDEKNKGDVAASVVSNVRMVVKWKHEIIALMPDVEETGQPFAAWHYRLNAVNNGLLNVFHSAHSLNSVLRAEPGSFLAERRREEIVFQLIGTMRDKEKLEELLPSGMQFDRKRQILAEMNLKLGATMSGFNSGTVGIAEVLETVKEVEALKKEFYRGLGNVSFGGISHKFEILHELFNDLDRFLNGAAENAVAWAADGGRGLLVPPDLLPHILNNRILTERSLKLAITRKEEIERKLFGTR